jgi:hypothetical protein
MARISGIPPVQAGLALVLIAVVLVGAFVVGTGYSTEILARSGEHGPSANVVDLRSVDQLQAAFNADGGTARLLVLFSPT